MSFFLVSNAYDELQRREQTKFLTVSNCLLNRGELNVPEVSLQIKHSQIILAGKH